MKGLIRAIVIAVVGSCLGVAEAGEAAIQLKQTIPLPGVEGRIDHFDFDATGERLFVCALGNNTVEVVDLNKGERVHTIRGLGAPQSVAFVPELNRLLVANDKGGVATSMMRIPFSLLAKWILPMTPTTCVTITRRNEFMWALAAVE